MEYIGDLDEPAPCPSDVVLGPEEVQSLFDCVLYNIELALKHGRIHGDLSAYNILYWQGAVTLIDFARYGMQCDAPEIARDIWRRHMGPLPELV